MTNTQQHPPTFQELFEKFARRANFSNGVDIRDTKSKGGWVYIVECKGLYKIGCTSNLNARVESLQTATPFDMKPIHVIYSEMKIKIERALHLIFAESRVRGEWFNLSLRDVAKIKSLSIQEILDMASKLKQSTAELSTSQLSFDFDDNDSK